jgi:hypothetical protein
MTTAGMTASLAIRAIGTGGVPGPAAPDRVARVGVPPAPAAPDRVVPAAPVGTIPATGITGTEAAQQHLMTLVLGV